ncbi:MAG: HepT-like ribonuclease domain-containing protein [Ginsengibacter sp.]
MYNYKNILFLVSAIAAAEKAMHYSQGFTTALEFLESNEQVYFNGTITLLIAIGEEVKKIDKQLLQSEPNIEWQNISDMRNVLAHDYRGVDEDIVFKIVKIELPRLKLVMIEFLKVFPKNEVEEVLETKQYKHLKGII